MTRRIVDVLVPVALDQTYSYRVPDDMALAPGDIVNVPLGARAATAVVWAGDSKAKSRPRQPPQGDRGAARRAAAQGRAARLRRLGLVLHAEPARNGAAHGIAHGRAPRASARAHRRAACGRTAEAPYAGPQPGAGAPCRRPGAR